MDKLMQWPVEDMITCLRLYITRGADKFLARSTNIHIWSLPNNWTTPSYARNPEGDRLLLFHPREQTNFQIGLLGDSLLQMHDILNHN